MKPANAIAVAVCFLAVWFVVRRDMNRWVTQGLAEFRHNLTSLMQGE